MTITNEEVVQRYYAWAETECTREIESDFARVRRILQPEILICLAQLELWSKREQTLYLTSVLRSRLFKRPFGPEASALSQQLGRFALSLPKGYADFERRDQAGEFKGLSRAALRMEVVNQLGPILGPAMTEPDRLRFVTHVGGVDVETSVDFMGKGSKLTYYHRLFLLAADRASSVLPPRVHISVGEWCGVGASSWNYLAKAKLHETVRFVKDSCEYFLSALTSILGVH